MIRQLLLIILLLSGCATKMSHLGADAVKMAAQQEKKFQMECYQGKERSCFKYIRYIFLNQGYEKAKQLSDTRCKNKENSFCYGQGLVEFLEGNIINAKKIQQDHCDANVADSCYFLGYLKYQKDSAKNNTHSNDYFAKACKLGQLRSCFLEYILNKTKAEQDNKGFKKIEKNLLDEKYPNFNDLSYLALNLKNDNPKFAKELFSKYCQLGDKNSCYYNQYLELSTAEAFNKRSSIMDKECKIGSGWACLHQCQEEFNKGNIDAAYMSCKKSCFSDEGPGCQYLAKIVDKKGNIADAEYFAKIGCVNGSDDSCHLYAFYLEKQRKTDEALAPLKIICENGNVYGCLRLSYLYGQSKQMDESAKYALMGCDYGNGDGCYSYAVKLHKEKDTNATEYFDKSCNLKSGNGCMGMCLAAAEKGDLLKSRSYLIKTCETSTTEICLKYHDKKPEELDIDLKELKNICHYDPDKPWWYWAIVVGAGVVGGQVVK